MTGIRSFDAYPKVDPEFSRRTKVGGFTTLLGAAFTVYLLLALITEYVAEEVESTLVVDATPRLGARLRIVVNVTFPGLPCALILLNTKDALGKIDKDVHRDIFKLRLSDEGEALGKPYRQKIRDLNTLSNLSDKLQSIADEGCNCFGHLDVNKVSGSFTFVAQHLKDHGLVSAIFGTPIFNMSHVVHTVDIEADPNDRHRVEWIRGRLQAKGWVSPLQGHVEGRKNQSGDTNTRCM